MTLHWWTLPVTLETRRVGQYLTIGSADKAAEYMFEEWPGNVTMDLLQLAQRISVICCRQFAYQLRFRHHCGIQDRLLSGHHFGRRSRLCDLTS